MTAAAHGGPSGGRRSRLSEPAIAVRP
ncbi:MAG: hypothetical protein QOK40_3583, partial [Miltoncostaeaceae bacterium]|nr:hypothetical protein [Miltoncostaeaceae bacterium]